MNSPPPENDDEDERTAREIASVEVSIVNSDLKILMDVAAEIARVANTKRNTSQASKKKSVSTITQENQKEKMVRRGNLFDM